MHHAVVMERAEDERPEDDYIYSAAAVTPGMSGSEIVGYSDNSGEEALERLRTALVWLGIATKPTDVQVEYSNCMPADL